MDQTVLTVEEYQQQYPDKGWGDFKAYLAAVRTSLTALPGNPDLVSRLLDKIDRQLATFVTGGGNVLRVCGDILGKGSWLSRSPLEVEDPFAAYMWECTSRMWRHPGQGFAKSIWEVSQSKETSQVDKLLDVQVSSARAQEQTQANLVPLLEVVCGKKRASEGSEDDTPRKTACLDPHEPIEDEPLLKTPASLKPTIRDKVTLLHKQAKGDSWRFDILHWGAVDSRVESVYGMLPAGVRATLEMTLILQSLREHEDIFKLDENIARRGLNGLVPAENREETLDTLPEMSVGLGEAVNRSKINFLDLDARYVMRTVTRTAAFLRAHHGGRECT
ncbi:hypothetical protein DFS34DRAFT_669705 [Phlyctochytrium arcticum]|nr:hypothetical protein DFS34DRAFT_669705 [Phlyctochytrium arcticum]